LPGGFCCLRGTVSRLRVFRFSFLFRFVRVVSGRPVFRVRVSGDVVVDEVAVELDPVLPDDLLALF
jgi:hypothetical protein